MKEESKEIIKYIENARHLSEKELANAIKALGQAGEIQASSFLLNLLKKNFDKYSWEVRNAIAISLGDLGADDAVTYLMSIVKNKSYNGYNGSFLFAIGIKPLSSKQYFLDFIDLLCTGSFEIRSAAYHLIEHYAKEVDNKTRQNAINKLRSERIVLESSEIAYEKKEIIYAIELVEEKLNC